MKIGITHRLFLSILASTCLAVLSMFFIMQWNINRGFIQYLNQGVLERLSEGLSEAYAGHGNWDFLRDNPEQQITQMLVEQFTRMPAEHPDDRKYRERFFAGPEHRGGAPLPPPPEGFGLNQHGTIKRPIRGPHFILLDSNRNLIAGDYAYFKDATFRPIMHEEKTVGYIGITSPKHFLTPPQIEFLKKQKSTLFLAALGMALAVAIFSVPIARRLVRPIKSMAAATHELASGKYSVRVPVSSSDELGQLARNFNALALTLEKNEKARRQWVADISHELRTPLSVLRGEIEALMEGIRITNPESIRSLHAEVMRLHRLVDDLYQLALSDIGALSYHKEELDLPELLDGSIESYREEFIKKGITFAFDASYESELTVFADRERMHQLFGNLLDNSLKYTDAGGKLVIRLSCRNNKAEIEFQDSAPSVSESDLDRLFDRLYRVEGSRNRASGGAGLGLAICKNIAEAHDGTVSAHPSPLGGVLIRLALPIVERRA